MCSATTARRARGAIGKTTVDALGEIDFAAGSMGPKVEGACRFVEATGGLAAIGQLADAARLLNGDVGTIVYPKPAAGEKPTSSTHSQKVPL